VPEPIAHFVPGQQWNRPSDYVEHLAKKFEDGVVDQKTGKKTPRPLKREQVFFIAHFAAACNAVWDDEKNDVPMKERQRFNMLLMGQGGSGKTALIQEIVLPTMDFIFPPEEGSDASSSLIVCAKWSQAENISTVAHKAVTCHSAASMGIGQTRNAQMMSRIKK